MTDQKATINRLKKKVQRFCEERNWDQYHGAKDLAIGVITEASELLEHFRFKTPIESEDMLRDPVKRQEITEELIDVLHTILRFAQKYDIDLTTELAKKMVKNAKKHPVPAPTKKK
jgi:NTP pyrophosphatase (non-canonical NTP hydrolase)